jgi:hypothetical protein
MVIDSRTQAILEEVVRRESRSLLSYIGDAFPWTTTAGSPALATLDRVVKEEGAAVAALGRFLVRNHVMVPPAGAYPSSFTSYNFVALSFLVPRLEEEEKRSIAVLEADLGKIGDAARAPVEALLAIKKKNLEALSSLETPVLRA